MLGLFDDMLQHTEKAVAIKDVSPLAHLMHAEALISTGAIDDARDVISGLEWRAIHQRDAQLLARIAELLTQLGDHHAAYNALTKAQVIAPNDSGIAYNLASAEIACGNLVAAETRFDDVIAKSPTDFDAAYNRATIRTQTKEKNHVAELKNLLNRGGNPRGEFAVCYALAKELEDLGEYDESFAYLKRGAVARRNLMQYRVENDLVALDKIEKTFDENFLNTDKSGHDGDGNIFIVGLPRSGTTLIDRILSSHPEVESVGEVNDFALSLTRHAGGSAGKETLIEKSIDADFEAMGAQYHKAVKERSDHAKYVVDKTPLNFLYIGLIAKALPNARIIHVLRDEMDVGFAMYKTLFRMGYPFSYDLNDIGRYIRAKAHLMTHWENLLSDRITTVSYETLVAEPETQIRNLIDHLGLTWDDQCLEFHENKSPTATASAAQVRRPIYSSSIQKWRHYENHLGDLSQALSG
ncbi:tetratricopeptide repeat-containing sulfotransferase family protein [Hyphococcus sp. DH-69]|uniref:tetratricopeptide repeat-containing sulfotransferase family protein n=1 Tax=Hyphococcus formosus TaxID=3143534 RepID=UPI00398A8582